MLAALVVTASFCWAPTSHTAIAYPRVREAQGSASPAAVSAFVPNAVKYWLHGGVSNTHAHSQVSVGHSIPQNGSLSTITLSRKDRPADLGQSRVGRLYQEQDNFEERPRRLPLTRNSPVPPFPDGSKCLDWTVISIPPELTYFRHYQRQKPFEYPNANELMSRFPPDLFFGATTAAVNQFLLPPRTISVWLPPCYNSTARHPVLYCHDGENAAVDSDSWTGHSWRIIGAISQLQKLSLLEGEPPILVLLPSANSDVTPGIRRRHLEYGECIAQRVEEKTSDPIPFQQLPARTSYSQSSAAFLSSPFAEAHVEFVAQTLKPYIDSRFHCRVDGSFLIGTSMGGQASLRLLLRYPHLFCGAACLSPYFGPTIFQEVDEYSKLSQTSPKAGVPSDNQLTPGRPHRVYLDVGGDGETIKVPLWDIRDHLTSRHWWNPGYWWLDTQLQPPVQRMYHILRHLQQEESGRASFQVSLCQYPGARHNERAWSQRIHEPLLHLFGKHLGQLEDSQQNTRLSAGKIAELVNCQEGSDSIGVN
jgi:predicted alpha/beta superfamily hydrolase